MIRALIIVTLILLAVPLFNKVVSYSKEKIQDVKEAGQDAGHTVKATGKVLKEVAKEIPHRIKEESNK